MVERVARKHGTHFFDFAALMPEDTRYWSDGRHVNEEGSRLKGELFADWIAREILADTR